MSTAERNYTITLNDSQFSAGIESMEKNLQEITTHITDTSGELDSFSKKLADAANQVFSVENLGLFVQSVIKVRNEYQQLDITFSTILKSKTAADALMRDISSFAGATTFGVKESADAAKELLSYGTSAKDVATELKTLGDVALGISMPIAELATVYGNLKQKGTASSGDISDLALKGIPIYQELSKVMNVGEAELSRMINSGKVGFPEIESALNNMTAAGGMFFGLMEAQSGTLGGHMEELRSAWDNMMNSMGQDGEGFLGGAISAATSLVENYRAVLDILTILISTYGAYKAAVMASTAMEAASVLIKEVSLIAGRKLNVMQKLSIILIELETRAKAILNATSLANPYILLATAIVGVGVAIYTLTDNVSAYEKAQKRLNEENAKAIKNADDLKSKVGGLSNVLQDKNATDYQQNKAFEELQALYPRIFGNLSKEAYMKLGVAEAQKMINKENDRMNVESFHQRYEEANTEVDKLNEQLRVYQTLNAGSGGQYDSMAVPIARTRKELEAAKIVAAELGSEYNKHKAALDYANMSHKEKLRFLKEEKAQLEAQRTLLGGFEKLYVPNDFFKDPNEVLNQKLKSNEIKTKALNAPKTKTPEDEEDDKRKREQALKEREDRQNRYADMMQKIYGVNEKYNDKFITDDQKKLDEIRKDFAGLQAEINKHNADSKNKKVNTNLKPQLEKALEGQKYENETERLNKSLEEKKALFLEYESYKTLVGKDEAEKRAKGDLKTFSDYGQLLDSEIKVVEEKTAGKVLNASESKRLTDLRAKRDAFTAEEKSKDATRFAEAYKAAETSAQKELAIKKDYEDAVAALRKGQNDTIDPEQEKNLKAQYDASIEATREEAYKKSEIYKKLAEETLILNREQLEKQIKIMRSLLKNPKISEEMKADVQAQLAGLEGRLSLNGGDDANLEALNAEVKTLEDNIAAVKNLDITKPENAAELKRLRDKLLEVQDKTDEINKSGLNKFLDKLKDNKALQGLSVGLGAASEAASTMSQALGGVDTEAGYTLDTIGQLAGAAGDVAGAIVSGNPVKMVGAAVKAVGTLFSIGKRVREMNEKARKEVEDFYSNAIKGEREYQDSLKERALQSVRDNKTTLQGIKDELKIRQSQIAGWKAESDEIMGKLGGMSSIASETYKHGTWFRKAKVIKTYDSLEGKDYKQLSQLLSQGKLEGDAKALVERLKELEQKGYDAEKAIADLAKQTSEIFTGTTSDNLANSLLGMFKEGKTGAQDLADFFKQTMDDAALSIFKNKVLAEAMETFYGEFAKKAKSDETLTDTEIGELQTLFDRLMGDAGRQFEELKKITGQNLGAPKEDKNPGSPATTESTGSNTIKREMTEETGGILTGLWRGQFDLTRQLVSQSAEQNLVVAAVGTTAAQLLNIARANFDVALKIESNTFRTANNTDGISGKLDQIITNTQSSMGTRSLG
jgi:hypothetical protein